MTPGSVFGSKKDHANCTSKQRVWSGVAGGFVVTTGWTLRALVGQHAKAQKPKGGNGKSLGLAVAVIPLRQS